MTPEASSSAWGSKRTEPLPLFVLEFSSSCCEAGRNCSLFPEQPTLDGTNCQIFVGEGCSYGTQTQILGWKRRKGTAKYTGALVPLG